MKKTVILFCSVVSIVLLILFSGCGIYDQIDLEKAKKEIATLKTTSLDLKKIEEVLEQDSANFGTLKEVDLDSVSIDKEYIAKENGQLVYRFKQETRDFNTIPFTSYLIVKPAEDKKDLLQEQIDQYYQSILEEYSSKEDATEEMKQHFQNIMKKEYEGYLIYILSYNNEDVWKRIEENSHPFLFENTKEGKLEDFSLEMNDIKEFEAVIPNKDTSSSFYLIVRPKSGKSEKVKKQLNQYMKELEKKWSNYLPDEYQLVKNKMETEVGSYFVYIVSSNNQLVLKTIKDAVVKRD